MSATVKGSNNRKGHIGGTSNVGNQMQLPIQHKWRVLRRGKNQVNSPESKSSVYIFLTLIAISSSRLCLGSIKIPLWRCCVRTPARPTLCWTPDVGGLVPRLRFNSLRCDFSTSALAPWVWINVSGWLLAGSLNFRRAGWHELIHVPFSHWAYLRGGGVGLWYQNSCLWWN